MSKQLIKLAKRWNDSPTSYNETQFLESFNSLDIDEQLNAVSKGSEISRILIGWSAATSMEIEEELANT